MKAFYAYQVRSGAVRDLIAFFDKLHLDIKDFGDDDVIKAYQHRDPEHSEWYRSGLVDAMPNNTVAAIFRLSATPCLGLSYQWSERILPTSTIKEKVFERVQKLVEVEGRNPPRKEIAQIRDDVVAQLLPQAFIRRTLIPVLLIGNLLLIGTSSAKRADEVMAQLRGMLAELEIKPLGASLLKVKTTPEVALGNLVGLTEFEADSMRLEPCDKAVLEGPDGTKVSVKDDGAGEISRLVDDESFRVRELLISCQNLDFGAEIVRARVSDKLVFKGVKVKERTRDEREAEDPAAERLGSYMILADALQAMVQTVIALCDGTDYEDEDAL